MVSFSIIPLKIVGEMTERRKTKQNNFPLSPLLTFFPASLGIDHTPPPDI